MKYYKLIKNNFADTLKVGKIYPENFREWGFRNCDINYFVNYGYANFFEEVPAGYYFVQEGKMPEYFAIKRVEDNPLWQKYIDWLYRNYKTKYRFDGSAMYYGYVGRSSYESMFKNDIENFDNDPLELTLEQWDKIINKNMEEEFELPEKWCVRIDKQEVVDYCNVHGLYPPYKIVKDGTTYAHFPGWNDCTTCNGIKSGYTEVTYSQFVKHILNKEVMEENKEIIGWKLREDCKQYKKAIEKLVDPMCLSSEVENLGVERNCLSIANLRLAGVLELWFNPVYKEKTLKFGGYDVTFEKVNSGVRISCNGETGTCGQIQAIYNYFKPNSIYFKFGSQEVRKVIYDKKEWNITPDDDEPTSIRIGCTTGEWKEFVAIYEKAKSML